MTRIASRCVAETMDWNDTEPLLGGLRERLERDARWRRAGNAGDDDAFDDDGGEGSTSDFIGIGIVLVSADASERRFEMILGADVVHEEGMVDGVVRCLVECLDRERGVGPIVNPSPAHAPARTRFPVCSRTRIPRRQDEGDERAAPGGNGRGDGGRGAGILRGDVGGVRRGHAGYFGTRGRVDGVVLTDGCPGKVGWGF